MPIEHMGAAAQAPEKDLLFTPIKVGRLELRHRMVMAPLTRSRSRQPGNIPRDLNACYYAQRASAALIISEATQVSQQGQGYAQQGEGYAPRAQNYEPARPPPYGGRPARQQAYGAPPADPYPPQPYGAPAPYPPAYYPPAQ